jgi:hypothetical protein
MTSRGAAAARSRSRDLRHLRRRIPGVRYAALIALTTIAALLAVGCHAHTADDPSAKAAAPRSGATPERASRLLSQAPYVGVSCRRASSIACDRVGVAVWLKRPAVGVTTTIAGQRLPLRPPRSREGWWEGFLQPAGLLHGALRVTPDRGRYYWQGTHPRDVHVVVAITRASGGTDRTSVTIPLSAGWG